MGFKDGTNNPSTAKPQLMNEFVWAGATADAPWMEGGTYTVVRRIRITLEHWDNMELRLPGTGVRPPQVQRRADRQEERVRSPWT